MSLLRSMNKVLEQNLPHWPIILVGVYLIWSALGISKTISISPFCLIKYWTKFECWGCGTSRSIHAILHGNFREALDYNPLGYLVIGTFLSYLLLLIYKNFKEIK